MKILSVLFISLAMTCASQAASFSCHEEALRTVVKYMDYSSSEEFLKENQELFFCKSKEVPHREIFQWGDGSGLVGVEYVVEAGRCRLTVAPYTGQDDGDLDEDWAKSYCQE